MSKIATKVSVAIATCGIALAGAVAAPAAQAAPVVAEPAAPVTIVQPALAPSFVPLAGIGTTAAIDPPYIYIGKIKPNAPGGRTTFSFTLIPTALQPFFGFFSTLNFQVCFAGVGLRVGPYGTISGFVGKSC